MRLRSLRIVRLSVAVGCFLEVGSHNGLPATGAMPAIDVRRPHGPSISKFSLLALFE
jgi:hypothetical protein